MNTKKFAHIKLFICIKTPLHLSNLMQFLFKNMKVICLTDSRFYFAPLITHDTLLHILCDVMIAYYTACLVAYRKAPVCTSGIIP